MKTCENCEWFGWYISVRWCILKKYPTTHDKTCKRWTGEKIAVLQKAMDERRESCQGLSARA